MHTSPPYFSLKVDILTVVTGIAAFNWFKRTMETMCCWSHIFFFFAAGSRPSWAARALPRCGNEFLPFLAQKRSALLMLWLSHIFSHSLISVPDSIVLVCADGKAPGNQATFPGRWGFRRVLACKIGTRGTAVHQVCHRIILCRRGTVETLQKKSLFSQSVMMFMQLFPPFCFCENCESNTCYPRHVFLRLCFI